MQRFERNSQAWSDPFLRVRSREDCAVENDGMRHLYSSRQMPQVQYWDGSNGQREESFAGNPLERDLKLAVL